MLVSACGNPHIDDVVVASGDRYADAVADSALSEIRVSGQDLRNVMIQFTVVAADNGEELDAFEREGDADGLWTSYRFRMSPATDGSARREVFVRAECCDGQSVESPPVAVFEPMVPTGCQWQTETGDPLAGEVPKGTQAKLHVEFPLEAEGAVVVFQVYESDTTFNDFEGSGTQTIANGEASIGWTVSCVNDGLFDNHCEFFFTTEIWDTGLSCTSAEIGSHN
jgi:hypothetical protein